MYKLLPDLTQKKMAIIWLPVFVFDKGHNPVI